MSLNRKESNESIKAGASTSSSTNHETPCSKDCERNNKFYSGSHPSEAAGDSDSYVAGGIKNAAHGVLYQGKLILRLVSRSLDSEIDFKMATEMEAAEKFDDVVVFFREKNGTTALFVQAKHRLYPERDKIKYNDLTGTNGDFILSKYFLSFYKIMRDPLFNSNKKKFVICTNTSFDLDSFPPDILSSARDIDSKHNFFIDNTLFTGPRGKIYGITNENYVFIDELKKEVRKSALLKIKKSKPLQQLLQDHPNKEELYKRIFNLNNKLEKSKKQNKKNSLNEFPEESDWNEIKQHLNQAPKSAEVKELLSIVDFFLFDTYLTEWIQSYFEHLEFITEYPSEEQLDDILKKELILKPELKEINTLLDLDLLYNSWQNYTFDWFQRYENAQSKLARFKSDIDWRTLLNYLRDKLINTEVASISRTNIEKLKPFPVEFRGKFEELNDFLKSKEQVSCLKTMCKSPRLGTIKTLQHLDKSKQQHYIFTSILDIHVEWLSNLIIRSFASAPHINLLVIECSYEEENNTEDQFICTKITEILRGNLQKKVIIICSTESFLETKLKNSLSCRSVNINDCFKDLTVDSQNKILQMPITFQGHVVSIENLMDSTLASEIIDQQILIDLLEKKMNAVGNKLFFYSEGYKKNYYVSRNFHQYIELSDIALESSKIYFITGINLIEMAKLGIDFKFKLIPCNNGLNFCLNLPIIVCSEFPKTLLDSNYDRDKFYNEKFDYCVNTFKGITIHRLSYDRIRMKWIKLVSEEDFYKPVEKVLLIASDPGAGKSTVLSNIALGIKKQSQYHWVIRIDLNNFTGRGNGKSLEEIDFQKNEIHKAIEFYITMVFRDDNSKFQDFPKKLLKETLKGRKECKLRIVAMFDGFDEISPLYKDKTIKLIREIKASIASQVIVTTRLNEINDLERELDTQAWILAPLRRFDQVEYLNRFLKLKLSPMNLNEGNNLSSKDYLFVLPLFNKLRRTEIELSGVYSDLLFNKSNFHDKFEESSKEYEKILEKYDFTTNSNDLINSWEMLINGQDDFLAIPLFLKLFADVMIERGFEISLKMQILDLYDLFVKIKYEIYNKEKRKQMYENQATESSEMFLEECFEKMYHHLAYNLFFPKNTELADLEKEIKKWEKIFSLKEKNLMQEISRAGIVKYQANRNLQFIHRSFAEYYLSKCLVEYLGYKLNIQQILVKEMLPNQKQYSVILDFINCQLNQIKVELTVATDEISSQDINNAICNQYGGIVLFLLNCLKKNDSKISQTNYEEGTILHCAAVHGMLSYKLLVWFKENLDDVEFSNFLLTKNKYKQIFFHYFIINFITSGWNHKEVLQFLLSYFGIESFTKQLVFEKTFYSQQSILQNLLYTSKNIYEIKVFLTKFDIILDFLTKKLSQSNLRELVLSRDVNGETLLHTIAHNLSLSHICEFLNYLKDKIGPIFNELILTKSKKGETMLHVTVQTCSMLYRCFPSIKYDENTLKLLRKTIILLKEFLNEEEFEKLFLTTDENGNTIFAYLAQRFPIDFICEILDYLKDKTGLINKEIFVANHKGQTILHIINDPNFPRCRQTDQRLDRRYNPYGQRNIDCCNSRPYKKMQEQPCQNLVGINKIIAYLKCCLQPRDFEYLVLRKDDKGETMLFKTLRILSITHICDLLIYLKEQIDSTNKLILKSNKEGETILHIIVKQNYSCCEYRNVKEDICYYVDSLKKILTLLERNLNISDFEMLLLAKDAGNETILHKLVRNVSIIHMSKILNCLKDKYGCLLRKLIFISNKKEQTILHVILERRKSNFIFDNSYAQDGFKLKAILIFLNDFLNAKEFGNLILVKDEKSKNILHNIGSELSVSSICDILNSLKGITDYNNNLLLSKDNEESTILHATIRSIHFYSLVLRRNNDPHVMSQKETCIKEILTFFNNNLNSIDFKELLLAKDKSGENILHKTAQYLASSYFCNILNFLKDKTEHTNELFLARNERGQTLLHIAEQRFYSDTLYCTNNEENFHDHLDFLHHILTCLKVHLNPTDFEQVSFTKDMWGKSIFNFIFESIRYELEQC